MYTPDHLGHLYKCGTTCNGTGNRYKILIRSCMERGPLEDRWVNVIIILKWVVEEQVLRMLTS